MTHDTEAMKPRKSLAQRSINSISWKVAGSLIQVSVDFIRALLLARWLPVDVFGVYSFAVSAVHLSSVLPSFGMESAFLHRTKETQSEAQTAAIHFTLKVIFTLPWMTLMICLILLFTDGDTRTALLVITATASGTHLMQTAQLILIRRVVHRRLALLELMTSILTSVTSLALARQGVALWALLSTNLVAFCLNVLFLYLWRPVWHPRLAWSPSVVHYFLRFGSKTVVATILMSTLDRGDDLWTRFFLGTTSLGFYSRAYQFATYPRRILASPINAVAGGTYAELKGNRQRLSQAFFRANAFLLRSGFFLAGLLALIASEFIRIALTDKWLPMLNAFRLMLVFTLLDPIKFTVADLYMAMGKPEEIVRARIIQLVVLVLGLFTLGPLLDITGVALAVDLMVAVGIGILLRNARTYVDFSIKRLFTAPTIALFLGLVPAWWMSKLPEIAGSDWRSALVKGLVFSTIYGATLWSLEGRDLSNMLLRFWKYIKREQNE